MATPVRWRTTDDGNPQGSLFDADSLLDRHVGKGEFRGLEFLHVNTKRIINEVPEPSRMPFRYTINAYRGCSHACSYCLRGDTLITLVDGRVRQLVDLRVGDLICGGQGQPTRVLAHWDTRRRAFRLTLEDGTELVASSDHRFLADEGWRCVASLHPGDRLVRGPLFVGDRPVASSEQKSVAVVSVEALGVDMPMYDITTGTGDFIANGVVSHNCFARPTHAYLDLNIGSDFDSKIVVKINAVERLRAELHPKRWGGHHIAMGTNTDPYQRAEGKYHLTRGIVEVLTEAANPFSILTKSTLILRDLDLLKEAAKRTDVHANFSIGTLDEKVWKLTEPGTPHPRQRVEAVAKLNAAGVPCGVLVAPVLPHLSDSPEQIEAVHEACRKAGATNISTIRLHLRTGVREHFMGWLTENRPDLVPVYAQLYRNRAYLLSAR